MKYRIALIGNPNSGKTTMFNTLTGANQRVGNWPGVTVDRKSGKLKGYDDVEIVDLPGIYSLSPYSPEEIVSRDYLLNERPDAVINIVDATNLERNLYLTMQILDAGIPTVVALNMMDIVDKRGDSIDFDGMSKCLGCAVVPATALNKNSSQNVAKSAVEAAMSGTAETKKRFSKKFENAVAEIESILEASVKERDLRWCAIKLFERDEKLINETDEWETVRQIVESYEKEVDDDSESIVTNERYGYIGAVVKKNCRKSEKEYVPVSDKIDAIVTNRWLALPVFFAMIASVFILAIGWGDWGGIGTYLTDWVNDVFVGEWATEGTRSFLESAEADGWAVSLVCDGMIAGVGAVIGFLPQMLVLFLFLVLLEDCGYMARVAFMMDRVFRHFGLSGKSFIPALIGIGCGVPGVMASRTIESEPDRKITAMTTTFMPCSAKLPIIALFTGAITGIAWIGIGAYFIGIAAMLISGVILKKFRNFTGTPAPFIMELPPYHAPRAFTVVSQVAQRGWMFVKKAGTIILISSIIIWVLLSFDTSFAYGPDVNESILAGIGDTMAGIFAPLGFGDWQSAVATFTGLVAKENVVGTFGVMFGFEEVAEDGAEIWDAIAMHFTALSALSFLLFNLLCAPCFAAMGAMRRELGTMKATVLAITYQCLFAYAVSLIVYQFGRLVTGAEIQIVWFITAMIAAAILVFLLLRQEDTEERSLFGPIAKRFRQ